MCRLIAHRHTCDHVVVHRTSTCLANKTRPKWSSAATFSKLPGSPTVRHIPFCTGTDRDPMVTLTLSTPCGVCLHAAFQQSFEVRINRLRSELEKERGCGWLIDLQRTANLEKELKELKQEYANEARKREREWPARGKGTLKYGRPTSRPRDRCQSGLVHERNREDSVANTPQEKVYATYKSAAGPDRPGEYGNFMEFFQDLYGAGGPDLTGRKEERHERVGDEKEGQERAAELQLSREDNDDLEEWSHYVDVLGRERVKELIEETKRKVVRDVLDSITQVSGTASEEGKGDSKVARISEGICGSGNTKDASDRRTETLPVTPYHHSIAKSAAVSQTDGTSKLAEKKRKEESRHHHHETPLPSDLNTKKKPCTAATTSRRQQHFIPAPKPFGNMERYLGKTFPVFHKSRGVVAGSSPAPTLRRVATPATAARAGSEGVSLRA